jgi:hypothetical protein
MRSTIQHELLALYNAIIIESHLHHIFCKKSNISILFRRKSSLAALQQLIHTSDSTSKETIGLLLQMLNDITSGKMFVDREREKISFVIESAIEQRDLFKRYCDGEDVFNKEQTITPTPFVFLKGGLFVLFLL